MRLRCGVVVASLLVMSVGAAAEQAFSFEERIELELTQVNAADGAAGFGGNCVYFTQPADGITGSALVTWEAQSPLVEELEIVMMVIGKDSEEYFRVTGASPLTLAFEDVRFLEPDTMTFSALIGVQLPFPVTGAALKQPITMELSFAYVAEAELLPSGGGCIVG